MSVTEFKLGWGAAYSLLELMVVVVLLSIFATGVVWVDSALISTTKSSRDRERVSDVKSVALLFEKYYRVSPTATGSSYPTINQVSNSATLSSLVPEDKLLTPPNQSATEFNTAVNTSAQTPTFDEYIYQPFTANDNLCTSTPPCVRFVISYRVESTNEVKTIESSHQQ